MTALGVGIVGCGTISGIYMQNISRFAGLRLVACADIRADAARAAEQPHYVRQQVLVARREQTEHVQEPGERAKDEL